MEGARGSHEHIWMFDPGHIALRRGRWSESGRIYLVTFVTQGRRPLFRDFCLAAVACRTFAKSAQAAGAELLCWVLMPDHFHGLVQLGERSSLARCVQRIKGQSSAACRATMTRSEPVWSRAFHDHALRADEDVAAAAGYVIANPVRAGIVDDVFVYPYWDAYWLNG
jgi:REP-associated tyrosine transposase